jgi:hypothetical protein
LHTVVARSTFRSEKCKKLRVLSLFWREDVGKVEVARVREQKGRRHKLREEKESEERRCRRAKM